MAVWNECRYNAGPLRPVHPAVCEWHSRENDPMCRGCPGYSGAMPGEEDETHGKREEFPTVVPGLFDRV